MSIFTYAYCDMNYKKKKENLNNHIRWNRKSNYYGASCIAVCGGFYFLVQHNLLAHLLIVVFILLGGAGTVFPARTLMFTSVIVELELFFLPEHLCSPQLLLTYSGARVSNSLVFCVVFVDHDLSIYPFSFGHCTLCPSLMCVFLITLWYSNFTYIEYSNAKSHIKS